MDKTIFDVRNVANLLKDIVNQNCENGFVWYGKIGKAPNLMEINMAITFLENIPESKAIICVKKE